MIYKFIFKCLNNHLTNKILCYSSNAKLTLKAQPHFTGISLTEREKNVTEVYLVTKVVLIGVAPIMQYRHVRHKNSNTQGSSPNVVKVIFHALRNCS